MSDPQAPVPWIVPAEPAGPAPGVVFAPHGVRLVAYIIDGLILTALFSVLAIIGAIVFVADDGVVTSATIGDTQPSALAITAFVSLILAIVVVSILYLPFFWARGGQTPGMRLFGLVIVRDADGGRIGWGTALLRLVGLYVSSLVFYLGFIWIFIDKRHRGWHDLIASTVMIRRTREGAEGVLP